MFNERKKSQNKNSIRFTDYRITKCFNFRIFMTDTVPLAALGIISTLVVFLIWLLKYLFTDYREVMNKLILSVETNTLATKSADIYLRERNGRDIEFHKEIMVKLQDIPVQASKAAEVLAKELKRVGDLTAQKVEQVKVEAKNQTVETQTVEHQIIK